MLHLERNDGVASIRADMEHLCGRIGTRLAGSPEEAAAAAYVADRFRALGLDHVGLLPFACRRWLPGAGRLEVLDGPWREIDGAVVAHSPATPPEGVEGELVILEPVDWERGLRVGDLDGRIGLFYGGYGESAAVFKELHDSPLRALLFVDTRYQSHWPVANGMGEKFMHLARKPMAYIAADSAWTLAREGVRRVRLRTAGAVVPAMGHNVVGELPGADADAPIIVVSGHLDSVAVGVGADDDAAGVAAMIETARLLRDRPRRSTVRFIGFGAEEQLSVGSTRYVREQADDLDRIGFACNFDGGGAWIGLAKVLATGTAALETYVRDIVDAQLGFATVAGGVCPYQDMYPFAARGIPGVWFTRETHPGAYWYHHSIHNNLAACDPRWIAAGAQAAARVLADLAARAEWPFPRAVCPAQQEEIDRYERELFD